MRGLRRETSKLGHNLDQSAAAAAFGPWFLPLSLSGRLKLRADLAIVPKYQAMFSRKLDQ